jgi:capsular polysaccharide biosynthesis protein
MSNMKRIVRSYGWIVAMAILLGGLAAAFFTSREPELYEAVTTVIVDSADGIENIDSALRGLDSVSRRNVMATYAQIPVSRTVREGAGEELGLSIEQADACRVRTSIVPDTNVLRITVQGPTPQLTADFANSVVRRSQRLLPGFYDGIVSFEILDGAVAPVKPVDRGMARKTALGSLFGLILSVSLTFLLERVRLRHAFPARQAAMSPQPHRVA